MTIEEMRARKAEYGFTCETLAEASGVPLGTVQKIFSGLTKTPRKATIDALERVFLEEAVKENMTMFEISHAHANAAGEPAERMSSAVGQDVRTVEDYYALPEDQRVELIDGKFYEMKVPSKGHQLVLGRLHLQFEGCAEKDHLPGEVYAAPIDVRLDRDNFTLVQPDLVVVCHDDDSNIQCIEGAPDLVLEVLSSSTRIKDQVLKLYKYQNAGVREYWTVDFKFREVTVYYFEAQDYHPERFTFHDKVPVHISGGRTKIDFSGILEKLESHGW